MFFIDNDSQVSRQIYLHSRIMKNLPKSLYRNPSTINRWSYTLTCLKLYLVYSSLPSSVASFYLSLAHPNFAFSAAQMR